MANGHTLTFTWSDNRIMSVSDGYRTVSYTYNASKQLASVAAPLATGEASSYAKITRYGYADLGQGGHGVEAGDIAGGLLTSIKDPRGLETKIAYINGMVRLMPYYVFVDGAICDTVTAPNGVVTHFVGHDAPSGMDYYWEDRIGVGGTLINSGGIATAAPTNDAFTLRIFDLNTLLTNGGIQETSYPTSSYRIFSATTQDLIKEIHYTRPNLGASLASDRRLVSSNTDADASTTVSETSFNFKGDPLWKKVTEYQGLPWSTGSYAQTRQAQVDYAYWGADKYYQQRAVKDQAGRVSFTDYYDRQGRGATSYDSNGVPSCTGSSAVAKRAGQTYRVYSPKFAHYQSPLPSDWKYKVAPQVASEYSAQFDYESQCGSAIQVFKLQSTTTTPWTYVKTTTQYDGTGSPNWGAPVTVIEDDGGIARTTHTTQYDSAGRAIEVQDATTKKFLTEYDGAGVVKSVKRTDVTPPQTLVSYTYGATDATITNGMVTSVTDGLSGIVQSMTYSSTAGGSLGQVTNVTETNGSNSYSTAYTYTGAGERDTASYSGLTSNGATSYKYSDYASLGDGTKGQRLFQTLTKLDGNGNATAEQFHYAYDADGRIRNATFAMTPQSGQTGYSGTYPAGTRARAYYQYDTGGRLTQLNHYWDTWNSGSSTYSSEAVLANACGYELTGLNRGLKTASSFYSKNSSNPALFALDRTETYSYDASLDYLTGASYGDGLANASPTWAYDAAGNRTDSTCDTLNRATSISGVSRSYDVLGNTLSIGSTKSMGNDLLNRMTSLAAGSNNYSYVYRADGMRASKTLGSVTTKFAYDGQMPIESYDGTTSTKNILGARGMDATITGSGLSYPIYDAHGNNMGTLAKNGSGYTVANRLSYDAWGAVRSGTPAGTGRYCATLGHPQDDESGFIYMRARYYDASSGRFLSEDSDMHRMNLHVLCTDDPVNKADSSGKSDDDLSEIMRQIAVVSALLSLAGLVATALTGCVQAKMIAWSGLILLATWFNLELTVGGQELTLSQRIGLFLVTTTFVCGYGLGSAIVAGVAGGIVQAIGAYTAVISAFLSLEALEQG